MVLNRYTGGADNLKPVDVAVRLGRDIDSIVYKLFNLTPDEIALLESSLAGQY